MKCLYLGRKDGLAHGRGLRLPSTFLVLNSQTRVELMNVCQCLSRSRSVEILKEAGGQVPSFSRVVASRLILFAFFSFFLFCLSLNDQYEHAPYPVERIKTWRSQGGNVKKTN